VVDILASRMRGVFVPGSDSRTKTPEPAYTTEIMRGLSPSKRPASEHTVEDDRRDVSGAEREDWTRVWRAKRDPDAAHVR
jgi:hypothetical protein